MERSMGSRLSRITADTDVSTCGQSASSRLFSQDARSTSGSFVQRGKWRSASASTSGGMGRGGIAPSLRDFFASAAAALAFLVASASARAREPRIAATAAAPRSRPMHVPKTYTENALEISLRSQTMTAYTGATTGRTTAPAAPNAPLTAPSAPATLIALLCGGAVRLGMREQVIRDRLS